MVLHTEVCSDEQIARISNISNAGFSRLQEFKSISDSVVAYMDMSSIYISLNESKLSKLHCDTIVAWW